MRPSNSMKKKKHPWCKIFLYTATFGEQTVAPYRESVQGLSWYFGQLYFLRGSPVSWGTALQAGRSRIRYPMVSLEFSLTSSLRPRHGLGVESASNRNECQDYFLVGKGGRCLVLTTLPPSRGFCLEPWETQPRGTLRTCPVLYRNSYRFLIYYSAVLWNVTPCSLLGW